MVTGVGFEGRRARAKRAGSATSRAVSGLCTLALCLLVGCLAFGCQLIAGDFKVDESPSQSGDSSSCKKGEYRCNSEYLLACGSNDAGWILKQTCGSAQLCDSKGKHCQVCKPGDLRCDGVSRQECTSDGSTWKEVEACTSSAMCNPTFCGKCTPGEYSCRGESASEGNELWQCGADGSWSKLLDTCDSQGLCLASIDAARANPAWDQSCMKMACDPGAYSCDGPTLKHCRPDQTAWDVVDTCGTNELCAQAVATAAANAGVIDMCPVGCGIAGAFRCEGSALEQCRTDLTAFDTLMDCPVDTECNPVLGACTDLCTPGEYQCNDKTLRLCNSTRHWENQTECASAALCQVVADPPSGQCMQPRCPHAGDYSCSGTTLSKCRDDLMDWEAVDTCASADLCSAADKRCNEAACGQDELRCFGAELRKCNASLTAWDLLDTCETGEFCSNDAADPGCKLSCPSPTRCNGDELEACTPNGWVHQANCATNDLCGCTLDGSCQLGVGGDGCGVVVCGGTLPTFQCEGAALEKCADGRNGWTGQADCGQAILCYPGAAPTYQDGYCATCPLAGELKCVDGSPNDTLTKCSPDRKMWSLQQTCGSNGCLDGGTQDYCAACASGQVTCSGPTLQKCASDQRNFVNTTCTSAALCDAAHAQCDVCTANSDTCSGTGNLTLQHCSSDGQSIQPQVCPKYCDAVMGQCDGCLASTSRCADVTLYKCSSDGQTETPSTCATAALCNSGQQRCDTPTCTPTQTRCNGTQPQKCNTNQNGWSDLGSACATAALCKSNGTCTMPSCTPTQKHCDGAQPQVCNSDQTDWADMGMACTTPGLCVGGTCMAATCAPNDGHCNGAQPQTCNADQNGWDDTGMACATDALCVKGKCNAAACGVNEKQCDHAQPVICNSGRTGFQNNGQPCASEPLCMNGVCGNASCTMGQHHCATGGELQICNATFNGWDDVKDCGSDALCDETNGVCMTASCTAGSWNCTTAGVLQQCNADLTGYDDKQTCTSAALCDATHHECDDCVPPAYTCSMNALSTCDSSGHFGMPQDCGDGTCDATQGVCVPPP